MSDTTFDIHTEQDQKTLRIALVGNPNTGKTTLFNALTGLNQKVGNYPGVTVERKVGHFTYHKTSFSLIDLPGSYSLAARSMDEMLVTDVLLGQQEGEEAIDLIIAIVDASNIHRNFYLVSQLVELQKPLVIALNMIDIAQNKGLEIDADGISRRLGIPVVPISARRCQGIDSLLEVLENAGDGSSYMPQDKPHYPDFLNLAVTQIDQWMRQHKKTESRTIQRPETFRALVDVNGYAEKRLSKLFGDSFLSVLERERQISTQMLPLSSVEVKSRYEWVSSVVNPHVHQSELQIPSYTSRIDKILTHRFYGSVIFFCLMAVVFQSIYSWAGPVMDGIDATFVSLGEWTTQWVPEGALQSLLVDGVIAGVGSVLVFLPQIAILFFFIALLEDCGYLPRAAYLMDRLLSFCGLSGKSFIPMLSSFACAVPGIMATRTIEDRNDRLTTMLVAPLMSCSARLPVYLIFIAAFIPDRSVFGSWLNLQGLVLFGMYLIGILVAIPVAWTLKKSLSQKKESSFLLEMPTYKWPTIRNVSMYVFDRSKAFVVRAGTIIFCITILIWALAYFPHSPTIQDHYETQRRQVTTTYQSQIIPLLVQWDPNRYSNQEEWTVLQQKMETDSRLLQSKKGSPDSLSAHILTLQSRYAAELTSLQDKKSGEYLRQSFLGRMGKSIEPAVKPLGWDWRIGMATLASFPAREVIVAVMGTIYNLGKDEDESSTALLDVIRAAKREDGTPEFTIAVVLSIMVFFALCCQCAATLATIKRESNSYKWPLFTFVYMTTLAYIGAFITYQLGCYFGLG